MADFSTLITSLAGMARTASEIASSKDAAKRYRLLIEFQKATIEGNVLIAGEQAKNATLVARNHELEAEIVRLKEWKTEAENYVLAEADLGFFVYIYKPVVDTGKPRHWACAKCYQNGKVAILQATDVRRTEYLCPECKTRFEPGRQVSIDAPYKRPPQ